MHSASDCRRRPSCPDSTRRASPCLFDTFAVAHRRACCHRFWLTRKSNSQGQLARRVFLWQFTKLISADSRLQSKILHDIPVIIMKAVLAFKALVKDAHLAGLDVTDYVAERTSYFQDVLKEMDTDMTLRRFFSASGKVACHPLARVSRSELSSAYTQWCQDTHHKPQQWNADNVTDALGHMETKFRTNRAGNSWQETFQLQPKNDVGTPEPGGSERFYWGIGIYEDWSGCTQTTRCQRTTPCMPPLARYSSRQSNAKPPSWPAGSLPGDAAGKKLPGLKGVDSHLQIPRTPPTPLIWQPDS